MNKASPSCAPIVISGLCMSFTADIVKWRAMPIHHDVYSLSAQLPFYDGLSLSYALLWCEQGVTGYWDSPVS